MAYAERIHPPLSRNMLTEELNRIRPALSRDSLPDMRESVMPALSDRLLNAPEATSVPQHHQAQRIPPRPPRQVQVILTAFTQMLKLRSIAYNSNLISSFLRNCHQCIKKEIQSLSIYHSNLSVTGICRVAAVSV